MLKEQGSTITPCNVIVVLRIQQIENFGCKGGVVRSGVSEIVQPESFVVHCGVIIFVAIPFFLSKSNILCMKLNQPRAVQVGKPQHRLGSFSECKYQLMSRDARSKVGI